MLNTPLINDFFLIFITGINYSSMKLLKILIALIGCYLNLLYTLENKHVIREGITKRK